MGQRRLDTTVIQEMDELLLFVVDEVSKCS